MRKTRLLVALMIVACVLLTMVSIGDTYALFVAQSAPLTNTIEVTVSSGSPGGRMAPTGSDESTQAVGETVEEATEEALEEAADEAEPAEDLSGEAEGTSTEESAEEPEEESVNAPSAESAEKSVEKSIKGSQSFTEASAGQNALDSQETLPLSSG